LDALIALLALVGLLDASYLTVEHLSGRSVLCVVTTGCDEVLSSSYATLPGGIPLAVLGALAYFSVFSLATLSVFDYRGARTLIAPLVLAMFVASLWLFYVQAFVLGAFCTFCLLSALITTAITVVVIAGWLINRGRRLT
jgi:uncharacterized membrane protein